MKRTKQLTSKKSPWIAGIFNFIIPGTGYLYAGKRKIFSYLLIIGFIVAIIAEVSYGSISPLSEIMTILIGLPIQLAFAYDAYTEAK
jgi:hypothetical protein